MGNYVSCTLSTAPLGSRKARGARVILPSGDVRHFPRQASAAELMLEAPNFFLVNSRSLQMGRRFCPLSADEELEMGDVYIMFPMQRLNSLITPTDVGMLFLAASTSLNLVSGVGKVRILPDPRSQVAEEKKTESGSLSLDGEGAAVVSEFQYQATICRSRKPKLATILEETACST